MPIYEYRCPDGHTTDHIRRADDRTTPATCRCGKPARHVVISAFAAFRYGRDGALISPGRAGTGTPHAV